MQSPAWMIAYAAALVLLGATYAALVFVDAGLALVFAIAALAVVLVAVALVLWR